MKTSRLEAFSDGVLAIIITIMVLELKAPNETTLNALLAKTPIFLSYLFSFIYIGIITTTSFKLHKESMEKYFGQISIYSFGYH